MNHSKLNNSVGYFTTWDNRLLKTEVDNSEPNSWLIIPAVPPVQLTQEEKINAIRLGWDLVKLLEVKRKLSGKLSTNQIHKDLGYSRTTIDRYKKFLLGMDKKKGGKNSKKSGTLKSVFPNLLIISVHGSQWTFIVFWTIFFAFLIWLCVKMAQRRAYQAELREHKEKVAPLYFLLTRVVDLSFKRYPIICNSDKEKAYYKDLLKYYNNRGRIVEVVSKIAGESNHHHFQRKENLRSQYESTHFYEINKGKEVALKHWEKMKELNLLDYLSTPKKANWINSKLYILSVIQYLELNPMPIAEDRARKKLIIDLIPLPKIENQTISDIEPEPLSIN